MKQHKANKTVQPIPQQNNTLSLKEQLKQNTLDRYDLQEILGVSRNTILNLCKAGIIGYTRVGRKMYFDAQEINTLLKKREQTRVPGEGK